MTATTHLIDRERAVLMDTYARQPVAFVSGAGSWLTDADGVRYLDFLSGLAVVSVGHANPRVRSAVDEQMGRLVHVSNIYLTEQMISLAERLTGLSGMDRVFFSNDGATANEAAIKLARRHGQSTRGAHCFEVISLIDSFHGRTLATLAATGQPAKQAMFTPLPPGFRQVPAGDIDALARAIGPQTAAVLLETIQGEGGVVPLAADYLQQVRELCDRESALLVVDDVQAGIGRTGEWFSWQGLGFEPDIATIAKALANGLPIGACLARAGVASAFKPGDHATTFGGGPVVCVAALAVLTEIEEKGLLANCRERSEQLRAGLEKLPGVVEVRGRGLLLAAQLAADGAAASVERARHLGLLVNAVRPNAVRFAPPLTVDPIEVADAIDRFGQAVDEMRLATVDA
ncbi:MAG: acetylornithine transaminase [Actinomycetota bacterium]